MRSASSSRSNRSPSGGKNRPSPRASSSFQAAPMPSIARPPERTSSVVTLASRARRRVQGATPPQHVDLARQRQVVDAFLTALREGDFDTLLAVLETDVLLRDDSAALPPGTAALMRGAREVAPTRSPSRRAPSSYNPRW